MRTLPTRRNPRIVSEETPAYDELLTLRRLGRTKLTVKPGHVGISNATKPENLGHVEYAHLRAPLPEDLEDSEIFKEHINSETPSTYFLMRKSKDGYVSATGMFKVAFPWATKAEEKAEHDYLYGLDTTSQDNVAGNVWISPEHSLELAAEYGLTTWIRALLDPADITQSSKKQIAEPPKFDLPVDTSVKLLPPRDAKTPRARSMRSMSPAKALQPAAGTTSKTKSPRKRQTKAQKEANAAAESAAAAVLQSALDDVASNIDAEESDIAEVVAKEVESVLTESEEAEAEAEADEELEAATELEAEADAEIEEESSPVADKVKVEVEQAVEITNGTEITHTNVTVSMPAGLPELPLPEDTEAMLEKARQMVEEAKALEGSPKLSRKRKAEDVDPSDIDKELPLQPAKKAKVLEEKLKRERVRTRALVGVGAMLGIAAAIPYFL